MPTHILKVNDESKNIRLDIFLAQNLKDIPSRSYVRKLIDNGHVKVNEKLAKAHYKVGAGDEIFVEVVNDFLKPQYIEPEEVKLDIFYEDDYLIVINKPIGMTVHPANGCYSGTLVNALLNYSLNLSNINSEMRPGIIHRLDKETSGLILIAKDNITHTKIAKQFQRHTILKKYIALVEGEIEYDEGKIDLPLGKHPKYHDKRSVQYDERSKEAVTNYKVIKRHKGVTLVALMPRTGRTHQLRVHMSYIGHPILGDEKYGKKHTFPRLALHAQSIAFNHPSKKFFIEFSSRIPQIFLDKVNN